MNFLFRLSWFFLIFFVFEFYFSFLGQKRALCWVFVWIRGAAVIVQLSGACWSVVILKGGMEFDWMG